MKFICLFLILLLCCSCNNGNFSITGTVKSIEQGKDGYNAVIVDKDGKEYETTISRNDMGIRYKDLKIGDKAIVYGDNSSYGNIIHIHATRIVE